MYDPRPYTRVMRALQQHYGQPRQLVQGVIGNILSTPPLKPGDAQGFEDFALSVDSLVGLLNTLKGSSRTELMCGSHVDRLLTKLPSFYRDSFVEYCMTKGILQNETDRTYTLTRVTYHKHFRYRGEQLSYIVQIDLTLRTERRNP